MEIILVRHGQTEWSRSGRHTSRTDLPLIEEGRRHARSLRERFAGERFSLVLCSPLLRARETCRLAGLGSEMQLDDDLREWDYGDYEGLTTPQIRERRPDWYLWRDGCPNGEQPGDVAARADQVLARLRSVGGEAIVFAHGHLLRVLGARWVGEEAAFGGHLLLGPGAVSKLGFERDVAAITGWNEL